MYIYHHAHQDHSRDEPGDVLGSQTYVHKMHPKEGLTFTMKSDLQQGDIPRRQGTSGPTFENFGQVHQGVIASKHRSTNN